MRADIHDGPEHNTLQSEAGYIDAKPHTASSTKTLATHGRTIHLGQKLTNHRGPTSAIVRWYSKSGQTRLRLDCPLCAISDQCTAANSISILSPRRRG